MQRHYSTYSPQHPAAQETKRAMEEMDLTPYHTIDLPRPAHLSAAFIDAAKRIINQAMSRVPTAVLTPRNACAHHYSLSLSLQLVSVWSHLDGRIYNDYFIGHLRYDTICLGKNRAYIKISIHFHFKILTYLYIFIYLLVIIQHQQLQTGNTKPQ